MQLRKFGAEGSAPFDQIVVNFVVFLTCWFAFSILFCCGGYESQCQAFPVPRVFGWWFTSWFLDAGIWIKKEFLALALFVST